MSKKGGGHARRRRRFQAQRVIDPDEALSSGQVAQAGESGQAPEHAGLGDKKAGVKTSLRMGTGMESTTTATLNQSNLQGSASMTRAPGVELYDANLFSVKIGLQ